MVLIFAGALFTAFNITFEFPSGAFLGLLPDFVGYILIHVGIDRFLQRETYLKYQIYNSVIALRFLIGLSVLSWLTDLVFPLTENGLPVTLPGLFISILQCFLSIMFWVSFVHALEDVEREHTADLVTDFLMLGVVLWKGTQVLVFFCALIQAELFLTFALFAEIGTTILFIIELFRAIRRYEYV